MSNDGCSALSLAGWKELRYFYVHKEVDYPKISLFFIYFFFVLLINYNAI